MATFSWLTKANAITSLQARLNSSVFWSTDDAWQYICEGLRHWNGLTEQWNSSFPINNANGAWINTGTLAGSPRLRSVTDMNLYSQMCYMLLEPQLSSGAWAGTNQFTLANLQENLQKRVQEVIQATSCNIALLSPINATPGVIIKYTLPDNVLEVRRVRFMALVSTTTGSASSGAYTVTVGDATGIAGGNVISGTGIQSGTFLTGISGTTASLSQPTTGAVSGNVQFFQPNTLTREDDLAFDSFEPEHSQEVGIPQSWAVSSQPPISFDVDIQPTVPGYFDVLALVSSSTFSSPTASLLGIPDDWSMVPMYGALADVLGIGPESTDRQRASYCMDRYTQLLEIMRDANWMTQSMVNGAVSDNTSLAEMDSLSVNWQESQDNFPASITAGPDFIAPTPGYGQLLTLQLVGNAPLLDSTGVYVQVSKDDWEAVLNYAQHVGTFKQGGTDFTSTIPLMQDFYKKAAARNSRWATYGIFVESLRSEGKKQQEVDPRSTKETQ